jgi:hypothetical protein
MFILKTVTIIKILQFNYSFLHDIFKLHLTLYVIKFDANYDDGVVLQTILDVYNLFYLYSIVIP